MYAWKCWRDSRARVIVSLIALPVLCVFVTYINVRFIKDAAFAHAFRPDVAHAWANTSAFVLGGCASLFTLIWALFLGASSLGEEFKEKTAEFLLVRPRQRCYWVWMGWSVGVVELSGTAFATVVATFGALAYLTGQVPSWRPLAIALPLALGGAVVYGLTCFMTIVARSGQQGLSYGLGILFIHLILPIAVSYYWKIDVPSVLGFMIGASKWIVGIARTFPFGSLVLWIAIALAFPFASQLLLERAEV
jgi:ABC-type transport system involved in multi-copper enzyme maturation permease subunit